MNQPNAIAWFTDDASATERNLRQHTIQNPAQHKDFTVSLRWYDHKSHRIEMANRNGMTGSLCLFDGLAGIRQKRGTYVYSR